MRRTSTKIARFLLSGAALTPWALGALASGARADVTTYSGERRAINACVLVSAATSDGNGNPINTVPSLFYALDKNTTYRPGGWSFVNPLASTNITPQIYNRWKARGGNNDPAFNQSRPESQVFQVGAPLTSNMGAYWEVNLDQVTTTDLSRFNVVFLPLRGGRNGGNVIQFDNKEREKLRHFVDAGGTIWVENEGANGFDTTNYVGQFIVRLGLGTGVTAGGNTIGSPFHPVVNYPYPISYVEAQSLGVAGGLGNAISIIDPSDTANNGRVDPRIVTPLLNNNGNPVVYAGEYGSGHLLISGLGIGADINNYLAGNNYGGTNNVDGGLNDGVISGTDFANIPPNDLKFAYNTISWISSVPASGFNVRRSGSSTENIGHSLASRWSAMQTGPSNWGSGAVTSRNATFFVDGNNVLHAYDIDPKESLSGLLNPDDGLPDFSYGYPYDEIWNYSLGASAVRYSTPGLMSVYANANGYTGEHTAVAVTSSLGQTSVLNAFPRNGQGVLSSTTNVLFRFPKNTPNGAANKGIQPPAEGGVAPTALPVPSSAYSEGVLFVPYYQQKPDGEHAWHVQALDLLHSIQAGNAEDAFGAVGGGNIPTTSNTYNGVLGMPDICGPLAVGYVPDARTGAIDEVVYAFTQGSPGASQGQVQGLWFRTRNEPLQPIGTEGGNGYTQFEPHADRSWVPWFVPDTTGQMPNAQEIDLTPVIHIVKSNTVTGQVVSIQDLRYSLTGGAFSVAYTTTAPPDNPTAQAGQNYIQVTIPGGVPQSNSVYTYTVSADYALDWPAIAVGGVTPSNREMQEMTNNRTFTLYPGNQTSNIQYMNGGGALGPDDNLIFSTTPYNPSTNDGMEDGLAKEPLPDRVYSLKDQYAAQPPSPVGTSPTGMQLNWMFAPTYAETFEGITIKPRLVNGDNFRKSSTVTGVATGQVVNGDFHIVGQPVVSNGTIYAVANATMTGNPGFQATIILALNSQINNSIDFPEPIAYTVAGTQRPNRITVQQPDLFRSTSTAPAYTQIYQNVDFTLNLDKDATGEQFVRGITVLSCRSGTSMEAFNTALPIIINSAGTQQVVYNKTTGFGPMDNLLWALVIPYSDQGSNTTKLLLQPELQDIGYHASGGPSVSGNTLFYPAAIPAGDNQFRNVLVAVDLKSAAVQGRLITDDGSPNGAPCVHVIDTMTDPTTGGPLASNFALINPPVATENTVVVGGADGMSALDNQLTLIADNSRLLEVDADSAAVWSVDSTLEQAVVGGALSGNGAIANTHVPLSRPSSAQLTGQNAYLVADAGNNRIVQVDFGGKELDEIHTVNNDLQVLRPGDPVTLNDPTDVQFYDETHSAANSQLSLAGTQTNVVYKFNGPYYARHYLIADSGNYRAIEVVDIIDLRTGQPAIMSTNANGYGPVQMTRQVIFATRSLTEQNEKLRYRTIQQYYDPGVNYPIQIVAAVDNARQHDLAGANLQGFGTVGGDQAGPGGSIMTIQRAYGSTAGDDGLVTNIFNTITIRKANGDVARKQPISGPTWCKEYFSQGAGGTGTSPTPHYLMADANGCYDLAYNSTTNELDVNWMLSSADYQFLTGRPLQAVSVQRLTQAEYYTDVNGQTHFAPHYLITSAYVGPDNVLNAFPNSVNVLNGQVHGEVIEIRGRDYYDAPGKQTPILGNDGVYAGYHQDANQLYTYDKLGNYDNLILNQPTLTTAGSSIVRIIPRETMPLEDAADSNGFQALAITRSIGTYTDSTSTYSLQQPRFSDRP